MSDSMGCLAPVQALGCCCTLHWRCHSHGACSAHPCEPSLRCTCCILVPSSCLLLPQLAAFCCHCQDEGIARMEASMQPSTQADEEIREVLQQAQRRLPSAKEVDFFAKYGYPMGQDPPQQQQPPQQQSRPAAKGAKLKSFDRCALQHGMCTVMLHLVPMWVGAVTIVGVTDHLVLPQRVH